MAAPDPFRTFREVGLKGLILVWNQACDIADDEQVVRLSVEDGLGIDPASEQAMTAVVGC